MTEFIVQSRRPSRSTMTSSWSVCRPVLSGWVDCQQVANSLSCDTKPCFPFTVWILQLILNPKAKHVLFHLLPSEMENRWPCINLTRKIMMTGKSGHEPKQNCQAHRRRDYSSPYVLSLTERDNSMQVSRSTQRPLQTDLMIHKAE